MSDDPAPGWELAVNPGEIWSLHFVKDEPGHCYLVIRARDGVLVLRLETLGKHALAGHVITCPAQRFGRRIA